MEQEEKILLSQLPEVVWRLVFTCLGVDFTLLEACSEATKVFRSLLLGNGQVSLGNDKILPSVVREWIDRSDRKDDSQSEPMLLLLSLVALRPRITTFEIFLDTNFRPENHVLNSFLKLQSDHLEILYIYCNGLEENPIVLDVTELEMKNVRDLKIMRSVTRFRKEEWENWKYRKSLYLELPKNSFPALEKLTLSFDFSENWSDFLKMFDTNRGVILPFLLPTKVEPTTPMKHLRFIEFGTTTNDTPWDAICESRLAMMGALNVFQGLVSLEIPAIQFGRCFFSYSAMNNLKRLTLTLPTLDRHTHVFDVWITGYQKEICAALFADPTRDPEQIRKEIEENARKNDRGAGSFLDNPRLYLDTLRRDLDHAANLTSFQSLEEVRIKSESGEWAPTTVSCAVFSNMKSLRVLDFCGVKPMHIPDKKIKKMRKRFIVLCG